MGPPSLRWLCVVVGTLGAVAGGGSDAAELEEATLFAALAAFELDGDGRSVTRVSLGRAEGSGVRGLFANAPATVGDLLLRVPQ